jgi:hypothetical protein
MLRVSCSGLGRCYFVVILFIYKSGTSGGDDTNSKYILFVVYL